MWNPIEADKSKRIRAIFFFLIYAFISCVLVSTSCAWAETDLSKWRGGVIQAGGILRTLATSLGAIGVGWCGIEYTYGNEEVSRKALSKAIAIIAAVAAIYALPAFVRMGKLFGKEHAWDPSSLTG